MRRCFAVLSLAGSWLFAVEFFHRPDETTWALLVAAGVALNWGTLVPPIHRKTRNIAVVLLIPAVFASPAPLQHVAMLLLLGFVASAARNARLERVAGALLQSGSILFVQGLAVVAYRNLTAISHDVPAWFATPLKLLLTLAGYEVGTGAGEISIFTMRRVLSLALSWEYFLGPCAIAFVAGILGTMLFEHLGAQDFNGKRFANRSLRLLILVLVWMFAKTVFMTAVMDTLAWETDYEEPLVLMPLFFSGWVRIAALSPLAMAVGLSFKKTPMLPEQRSAPAVQVGLGATLLTASCAIVVLLASFYEPSGQEKGRRVLVDEHHGDWEPTLRAYDTDWYGSDSGYNYFVIYDYLSHYFEMGRLKEAITPERLKDWDVLVLKVPTVPYAASERAAIVKFVKNGGGLLLLGEHTDVFKTSSHINPVAREFAMEFRDDALVHIDTVFSQRFNKPFLAHPIVNFSNGFDFAVSSSIAGAGLMDDKVIIGGGLRALSADYHMSNFYPPISDYTNVQYGAFVQLLARRYGQGRVVAFSDSTIFSNFCVFEEGKSELMMGMVAWLNRSGGLVYLRWFLFLLASGIAAVVILRHGSLFRAPAFVVAVVVAASAMGGRALDAYHSRSHAHPAKTREYVDISIDRSVSRAALSSGGFLDGDSNGFGVFEQWLLRLGYFTRRRSGEDLFAGDAVVFFSPDGEITASFIERARNYVNDGGKIVVIDSVHNVHSTANDLLDVFGLSIAQGATVAGTTYATMGNWSRIPISESLIVEGGDPLIACDGRPVFSHVSFGRGDVFVIGFGADLADANMGINKDVRPDAELRARYDLEFAMARHMFEARD